MISILFQMYLLRYYLDIQRFKQCQYVLIEICLSHHDPIGVNDHKDESNRTPYLFGCLYTRFKKTEWTIS
ncbi:hypothetical protein [Sulfurovum sp. NBC37-1]|uniref:hypothetical protein n=1 Tax=Sulfurovum sp. (strain NBC37-1) TaxID=387093 RepID=UPI0002E5390A|nr:hypothetical protein [Sulfurovum sp. NBC37-1]